MEKCVPKRRFFIRLIVLLSIFSASVFAYSAEPSDLAIFRKSYPDVTFACRYDSSVGDYLITVTVGKRSGKLYWQGGRFLPKSEIKNAKKYTPVLYEYNFEMPDPAKFTRKDIEAIRSYSSTENRKNGPGAPTFLFDLIYESDTRKNVEKHITKANFLDKTSYVHDRILKPLKRVESRIKALALTDREVENFVKNLDSAGSYNWRSIADSGRRSFHSMGVAVDLLPVGWGQKNLYWAWRRDIDPDWMMLPLNKRWMPPDSVIKIFEEEGFIYGGKWEIWDNMHFEYRPELILYTKRLIEKRLEEQRAAERKKLEEQKAAERKKLEELKAAEKKRLEEEREAERKRLEEQKAAEEKKRLEEEREAERKRLEEQKAAEEKRLEEERKPFENQLEEKTVTVKNEGGNSGEENNPPTDKSPEDESVYDGSDAEKSSEKTAEENDGPDENPEMEVIEEDIPDAGIPEEEVIEEDIPEVPLLLEH